MTVPACLRLADDVFPRVRALAARQLVEAGWSQAKAGEALGWSQAMVSRHLAARKPAADPVVERLAQDLVRSLLDPSPAPAHGPSEWCGTLTIGQERAGGDVALRDLLAAEATLRAANPLRVMPQVGLNIARAVPTAAAPEDVLAFPGRLVEAGGRIVSPAPPAFGGSGHLARVLLAARASSAGGDAPSALANVRGGPDVVAAARRLGWPVGQVARGKAGKDPETAVLAAVRSRPSAAAWSDPGAVGLEPCLYVAGADAAQAAARILELHSALVRP